MNKFDPAKHQSLTELLYDELKKAILTCRIKPGTRLKEVELAEQMGVSRTPIREAMRQLEKDNLIYITPRRGTYVSELSMDDIDNMFIIREPLEGLAAYLAAQSATKEQMDEIRTEMEKCEELLKNNDLEKMAEADLLFHNAIAYASNNEYLISILTDLQVQVLRFRTVYFRSRERAEAAVEDHRKVFDAISSGDADKAKKSLITHIKRLRETIREG